MSIEMIRNTKLIRLKNMDTDNGRKKAKTGIQAGQAPSSTPNREPATPIFLLWIEQQL